MREGNAGSACSRTLKQGATRATGSGLFDQGPWDTLWFQVCPWGRFNQVWRGDRHDDNYLRREFVLLVPTGRDAGRAGHAEKPGLASGRSAGLDSAPAGRRGQGVAGKSMELRVPWFGWRGWALGSRWLCCAHRPGAVSGGCCLGVWVCVPWWVEPSLGGWSRFLVGGVISWWVEPFLGGWSRSCRAPPAHAPPLPSWLRRRGRRLAPCNGISRALFMAIPFEAAAAGQAGLRMESGENCI